MRASTRRILYLIGQFLSAAKRNGYGDSFVYALELRCTSLYKTTSFRLHTTDASNRLTNDIDSVMADITPFADEVTVILTLASGASGLFQISQVKL